MPTENRSSNTELISQAASAIEDLLANGTGAIAAAAWASLPADLRRLTAQPVPQPHPDPIAWMVGTAFWWTKEEAERDAAETGLPIIPFGPLTGSAEIEQLREVIKHSDAQIMRQSMRISNQRAQLAERDALLRDLVQANREFFPEEESPPQHRELMARYAALSTSAEPIKPAAPYPNRLCHIDYTAHPYQCGCLKGDEEAQRRYDEHCRKASGEQSAQVTAEVKP